MRTCGGNINDDEKEMAAFLLKIGAKTSSIAPKDNPVLWTG
jgi:hypothetical protein